MAAPEWRSERLNFKMIKVVIILYCLLLCLFLAVAVFGFLGDRIGDLPIWKTQAWTALRILVIVISIILTITVLVIIFSRIANKQSKAEKEFAQSQGWIYTESYNDPQGLTQAFRDSLEKVCPKKYFDVGNNMTVESGRRNVFLFRCYFKDRDWGHKQRHGFACLIESDRFGSVGSQVDIIKLGSFDTFGVSNQVDMGDSEFARNFIVTSKDPPLAKRVVSESLQAILLEGRMKIHDYYEIVIGPGGAVIITWAYKTSEEYLALVDLARRIESVFK
jgi:hypothetical protein